MKPRRAPALLCLAALIAPAAALAGCGDESGSRAPAPSGVPDDGLPASCNPLRADGACLLPFPSAIFLDEDPATKTGFRVHLRSETLPRSTDGKAYDPARM